MLQNQLDIQTAIEQLRAQEGAVRASAGPFDPMLNVTFSGNFSQNLLSFPTHSRFYTDQKSINGSVSKLTRVGTQYNFSFSYSHNFNGRTTPEWTENYAINFSVLQPLLRNLRYSSSTIGEITADLQLQATYYSLLQQISQNIQNTVNAYWEFAAAKKIKAIYHEATMLERERAKLGITLSKAELASKTQQLDSAELSYYQTLENLKLAMSLVEDEPCADEIFFNPEELPEAHFSLELLQAVRCRLLNDALDARYDLQALLLQQQSAGLQLWSSENNLLPQLDLVASVNLSNFDFKVTPAFPRGIGNRGPPQADWMVGVNFSAPFYNDSANGSYVQQSAAYESAVIAVENNRQQALTAMRVALGSHLSLGRQLEEIEATVASYRLLVASENEKMVLGLSTLYDLISFENSLTSSLVQQVGIVKSFFQNIVLLRHLSATLLQPTDTIEAVHIENLISL
jgi:outer membrane protein TolC